MADDPGTETTPALLLDRYRIEGMLGEGGLGTVVKGFDTRLKRMVAIKTLKRTSYADDPELFRALEERFAREAEAGSRMGVNLNLVTVYDLFVDGERTQYLFLEYVPGGTLADRIKQGPVPLADALRLTADVARGLMAAHNAGIVHRDIKPANVFIGEDGRAQVGDFGIAQIDDISGRTHTTASHPGTPLYMSPEQAHSTGYVRPSSDQYSLGLVLFELLTGQAYKRLEKHEADALLTQQPTTVAALITRMLAPEPGDRYPGMTGVLTAIQAIAVLPAQTLASNPPTLPAPPRHDAITQPQQTPVLHLQPVPPVMDRLPIPASLQPSQPTITRRAALAGIGGLIVAAGTAGAAMTSLRKTDGGVATATAGGATAAVAAGSASPPPLPLSTTPAPPVAAVANSSVAVVTVPPPIPIIITVPPVIITAPPVVITAPPIVVTAPPPAPEATVVRSALSSSRPGTVLYRADESTGFESWKGPGDWKSMGGMLVNDGSNGDYNVSIRAPYSTATITNYAIEAQIQLVKGSGSFGVIGRASGNRAYYAGRSGAGTAAIWALLDYNKIDPLVYPSFEPQTVWRTYRLDILASNLKLRIDNAVIAEAQDSRFPSGEGVGLWSRDCQINVRSFNVIVL